MQKSTHVFFYKTSKGKYLLHPYPRTCFFCALGIEKYNCYHAPTITVTTLIQGCILAVSAFIFIYTSPLPLTSKSIIHSKPNLSLNIPKQPIPFATLGRTHVFALTTYFFT
jgi:hypothetical protein